MIRTNLIKSYIIIIMFFCKFIYIQNYLFFIFQRTLLSTINSIIFPLLCSAVIIIISKFIGNSQICFLNSSYYFIINFILKFFCISHLSFSVVIFLFNIIYYIFIFLVSKPVIIIHQFMTMFFCNMFVLFHIRRCNLNNKNIQKYTYKKYNCK